MNFKKIFATSLSVLFISTPISLQAMESTDSKQSECSCCPFRNNKNNTNKDTGTVGPLLTLDCGHRVCNTCLNKHRWNYMKHFADEDGGRLLTLFGSSWKERSPLWQNLHLLAKYNYMVYSCEYCKRYYMDKTDFTEQFKKNGIVDVREAFKDTKDSDIPMLLVKRYFDHKAGRWLRCSAEGNDNAGVLFLTDHGKVGDGENFVTVNINGIQRKLGIADPKLRLDFERTVFDLLSHFLHIEKSKIQKLKKENPVLFGLLQMTTKDA